MFIYFIILPVILGARTPGQALLKLKLVREDGRRVRWHQVMLRNILLYVVEFVLINISGSLLSAFVMSLLTWDNSFFVMLVFGLFCGGSILVMLFFMLRCLKKYNMMPHSRYSHTLEVAEK